MVLGIPGGVARRLPGEERIVDEKQEDGLSEYAEWKARGESENDDPRELFRQVNHIALCMSYDLIDKLRWLEKETMQLPDGDIEKRLPHMATFLDNLKAVYLQFSDIDF